MADISLVRCKVFLIYLGGTGKLIPVAIGGLIASTTVVTKWGKETFMEGNQTPSMQVFVGRPIEEDCS